MTNQNKIAELIPAETIEETETVLTISGDELTQICAAIRKSETLAEGLDISGIGAAEGEPKPTNAQQKRIDKAFDSLKARLQKEKDERETKKASLLEKVEIAVRWHMTNPFSKWNGTEEECRQAMLGQVK